MDELMLLERVFLKIGSVESDAQLESVLCKFLCPVLLKLDSKTDGVQKKVMELLAHINKRVRSRAMVQLPMDSLLNQYTCSNTASFIKNFTIMYIKLGFPRLESYAQLEMLPRLLNCWSGRPTSHQASLLQLVIPCFQHVKLQPGSRLQTDVLGISTNPELVKVMLDIMMDVLLLPYNLSLYRGIVGAEGEEESSAGAGVDTTAPPPALSLSAFKRIIPDTPPSPDQLEKIKIGVIDVLASDTFNDKDIFCHLLVGSADTRHSVSAAADREMKRMTSSEDWNKPAVIAKLYSLFQGTVIGKTSKVKAEDKRTPASVQMRLKMFPYLLKSREACNQFPACLQVVFDCLFGTHTNAKLKNMAVQFVHQLCLYCPDAKFNPIASVLLNGMKKLFSENSEDPKLRSLAYVATGKICKRFPQVVHQDVALLQTFFDAICKEDAENRLAVQESLSLMSEAFAFMDENGLRQVEAIIMQNIDKDESQARLMAVQYAHTVFPSDHIPSRYVLLLGCGDSKDNVQTEAVKFLKMPLVTQLETSQQFLPSSAKRTKSRVLPSFSEMLTYIKLKASQRIQGTKRYSSGTSVLPFNPAAYSEMIEYLRYCLYYEAGICVQLEGTESLREQGPALASYVMNMLNTEEQGSMEEYIEMIRKLLSVLASENCMYCLLEVAAVARQKIAPKFVKYMDWIKGLMFSSREDTRVFAAELYALTVVYGESRPRHLAVLKDLTHSVTSQAFEGQHGSVLCLGHLIGYLRSGQHLTVEDMETEEAGTDLHLETAIKEAVLKIVEVVDSSQLQLSLAACNALGEIARKSALPLQDSSDSGVSKLSLVTNLLGKVNSDKTHSKLREKAATTVGYLCLGQCDFPHSKTVIEGLLQCAGPKQFELHITVGEALVCAALGTSSPAARDHWLVSQDDYSAKFSNEESEVTILLDLLLQKYVCSPNPHIKQAACIWLLALVKKCGRVAVIQSQLLQIQSAFMGLLSETDEMTQDIASKGLGVVYENCTSEQKKELVSVLVETLTTGKKRSQPLTGDSKVFDEGTLGKTPDGKNLSTYRELCSITNDLNQPDLIYKFMHLANHNSMWNSKKGAAFGFGSIAAQAGEQLAPYLHKIIPKLYRYQFDPNPKIQQAMSSIWAALVTESKKTVDRYLEEIVEDLLQNLTSRQWRVRESSCVAVSDLLRGRSLDPVIHRLPSLWETLFKVRDDIKESVRIAAESACKSLSRGCIKICDPEYGQSGEQATSVVLPCLLDVGLGNPLQEVRALSLMTILKISKHAGRLVKPHITQLVGALLESLSTLEPQYLNYVSLHVSSSHQAAEKLDNARIAASKSSPMMEVINLCIPFMDDAVMAALVPRLVELLRGGIGLATKAGCAHFIVSLTHQCPQLLPPHAGKLLGVLLNGLNDRNSTVKKTFGSTIGVLVKVAKDSSVEKLILRLKEWYFEKDDSSRQACGVTLQAIARRSPDTLKRHCSIALPLAFVAMHQKDEEDSDSTEKQAGIWQEVWLDMTPGTEAGVRLYLQELVTISQLALDSQAWAMKAQGAAAMQTIASKLGSSLGPPHLGILLQTLLGALHGRTWTGKEVLVQALTSVCVDCKEEICAEKSDQPHISAITEVLLKECKKENIKYKTTALKCFGDFAEAYPEIDVFADIANILFPLLGQKENETGTNDWMQFEEVAYQTLGQTWPNNAATQSKYQSKLHKLLLSVLGSSVWKVEVAVLKTYVSFIKKLYCLKDAPSLSRNKEELDVMTTDLIPCLCTSIGNMKYSSIRMEALRVLETFCTKLKECDHLSVLQSLNQLDAIVTALKNRSNDIEPGLSDRALTLSKLLQNIEI